MVVYQCIIKEKGLKTWLDYSEELPWSKNIVERILEYKSLRTDFCPKMSAMQSASSCSCSLCIVLFSLSNIIPLPG